MALSTSRLLGLMLLCFLVWIDAGRAEAGLASACCGDGLCLGGESSGTCALDCCGSTTPDPSKCGNGICDCWERSKARPTSTTWSANYVSCPKDCQKSACGNGFCENGEQGKCVTDCGSGECPSPTRKTKIMTRETSIIRVDTVCPSEWTIEEPGVRGVDFYERDGYLYVLGEVIWPTGSECRNLWLAKYRTCNGAKIWAKNVSAGSCEERAGGIAVDSFGGIYVTGASDVGAPELNLQPQFDIFVLKFNSDGESVPFLKSAQSSLWNRSGDDIGYDIAVDQSSSYLSEGSSLADVDSIYVAGMTYVLLSGVEPSDLFPYDAFLMRYNPAGLPFGTWLEPINFNGSGNNLDRFTGIASDDNFIWVTGSSVWEGGIWSLLTMAYTRYGLVAFESPPMDDPDRFPGWTHGLGIDARGGLVAVAGYFQLDTFGTRSAHKGGRYGKEQSSKGGGAINPNMTIGFSSDSYTPRALSSILVVRTNSGFSDPIIQFFDTDNTTHDVARGVAIDSQGNIIYTGTVQRNSDTDIWIRKYSPPADVSPFLPPMTVLWEDLISDPLEASQEFGRSVEIDDADFIYLLGNRFSFPPVDGPPFYILPENVEPAPPPEYLTEYHSPRSFRGGIGTLLIKKYPPTGPAE